MFFPSTSRQCSASSAARASFSLKNSTMAESGPNGVWTRTDARAPYGLNRSYNWESEYPRGRCLTKRGKADGGGRGVGGFVGGYGDNTRVIFWATSGIGLPWRVANAFSAAISTPVSVARFRNAHAHPFRRIWTRSFQKPHSGLYRAEFWVWRAHNRWRRGPTSRPLRN